MEICELGMVPAVAYLVLARGTGKSNIETSWSTNSIQTYTSVPRRRAQAAIAMLLETGALEVLKAGKHPRYRFLFDDEEVDDWVWLPNELVTGADGEVPPVERVRQSGDVLLLQMLVDFYFAHELTEDAGVSRRLLRIEFNRKKIAEAGEYDIWGFTKHVMYTTRGNVTAERYMGPGDGSDLDNSGFFDRVRRLDGLGLLYFVPFLCESDSPDSELIHPFGGDLSDLAEEAAYALLPDAFILNSERFDYCVPVLRHFACVTMVAVARLRYRPNTRLTSSWYGEERRVIEHFTERYAGLARKPMKQKAAPGW